MCCESYQVKVRCFCVYDIRDCAVGKSSAGAWIHVVQLVSSDNGTEFMGALIEYMKSRGIQRELGAPNTPEQVVII